MADQITIDRAVVEQARLAAAELRADCAEQCAQTEAARADHAEAESRRLSEVVSLANRRSDHLGIRLGEVIAERDALRMDVDALRAERDEDRRREYGYSQQTVDAITNERDALRAALEVARRVIAHDRQSLIDCSTNPAGAIDRDAAEHVAYYDAALAQIDEATKGGGNG